MLDTLMADQGLTPAMVEWRSRRTGHPDRTVSERSIYRVLSDGHKPTAPVRFEIAAALGVKQSDIWQTVTDRVAA